MRYLRKNRGSLEEVLERQTKIAKMIGALSVAVAVQYRTLTSEAVDRRFESARASSRPPEALRTLLLGQFVAVIGIAVSVITPLFDNHPIFVNVATFLTTLALMYIGDRLIRTRREMKASQDAFDAAEPALRAEFEASQAELSSAIKELQELVSVPEDGTSRRARRAGGP